MFGCQAIYTFEYRSSTPSKFDVDLFQLNYSHALHILLEIQNNYFKLSDYFVAVTFRVFVFSNGRISIKPSVWLNRFSSALFSACLSHVLLQSQCFKSWPLFTMVLRVAIEINTDVYSLYQMFVIFDLELVHSHTLAS